MHIHTIPNRNSKPTILLRESFRDGKSVKKRTLCNLSSLSCSQIEAIRMALAGKKFFNLDQSPQSGPIYAVLDTLNQIAQQTGLSDALGSTRLALLAKFLVYARIGHQGSRLSSVRWARNHCVEEILGLKPFDEDDLYEALDWINENQEQIEKKLYERYLKEHGSKPPVLVLYDVTSSYLEGECNELAQYGYNRDGKKGKKQIVFGLLTDPQGEPLSIEVFEGSTSDPTTFPSQVKKLQQRFGIEQVVFVGDRGMIKGPAKMLLNHEQFKFITSITEPQIRKYIKTGEFQLGLFEQQIAEIQLEGYRYVLRRDPFTCKKERNRREDKLKKLHEKIICRNTFVMNSEKANPESGLKHLVEWTKHHKLCCFVELSLKDRMIEIQIDEEKRKKEEDLDGCYVIQTDIAAEQMSAQQVHDRYKDLQMVEKDFATMKTDLLEVRPIYLLKKGRTQAHVFVTMLALKLIRVIRQRLKEVFGTTDDIRYAATEKDALGSLSRITLVYYPVGKSKIIGLLSPDSHQQSILAALKVKLTPPPN